MKSKKSIFFNIILFISLFALTLVYVLHGEDLSELAEYIYNCDKIWLLPAILCVFLYIFGESVVLSHMLGAYKIKIKKIICFLFSSVGFFFSCITPSASGGQPMQIYFMKKERIPVPVATVILIIVTITYKTVLVLIGIGAVVFAHDFLDYYFVELLPVFYLGIVLNVAFVITMILVLLHPTLVKNIILWIIQILNKLHVLKNTDKYYDKIEEAMVSYHEVSIFMVTHKFLILQVFAVTVLQRFALFAVTCFVYKAFRLSGTGLFTILMLQGMIAVAVDMLPLPGGMGISETLFLVVFEPIFEEMLLPGMVLSRGIGYYSELLISAIFTFVAVIFFSVRNRIYDNEKNLTE